MEKTHNWEMDTFRSVVGEEAWHEVLANLGGVRIVIPRTTQERTAYIAELVAVVGEETFARLVEELAGTCLQLPVPSVESVEYYYLRGKNANDIAFGLRMSYSRVSEIIKKYQDQKKQY